MIMPPRMKNAAKRDRKKGGNFYIHSQNIQNICQDVYFYAVISSVKSFTVAISYKP